MEIWHVCNGISFLFIGDPQWCLYKTQSKSDWRFNTQWRVLQADWLILETNGEEILNINRPYQLHVWQYDRQAYAIPAFLWITGTSYHSIPRVICKPILVQNSRHWCAWEGCSILCLTELYMRFWTVVVVARTYFVLRTVCSIKSRSTLASSYNESRIKQHQMCSNIQCSFIQPIINYMCVNKQRNSLELSWALAETTGVSKRIAFHWYFGWIIDIHCKTSTEYNGFDNISMKIFTETQVIVELYIYRGVKVIEKLWKCSTTNFSQGKCFNAQAVWKGLNNWFLTTETFVSSY